LLDPAALRQEKSEASRAGAVLVSAVTGYGLDDLRAEIERRLNLRSETIEIALKPEDGALAHWIHENCVVLQRRALGEGVTALRVRVAPEKRDRLARLAGAARLKLAAE
ncbi:MAG TPA: GTPase HflX, partial [Methyloceanibacter sp.]|nr:GTPase HflX [Methyloceanibacter sp.]